MLYVIVPERESESYVHLITQLNNLPLGLQILFCDNNYIENLNNLPPNIRELYSEHNSFP